MKVQYGDTCLSLQQVYKHSRKFANGINYVADFPQPGQAIRVVTSETTAAVDTIMNENLYTTVDEIAACMEISTAYDVLQINKVSAKWVPTPGDCRIVRSTC